MANDLMLGQADQMGYTAGIEIAVAWGGGGM